MLLEITDQGYRILRRELAKYERTSAWQPTSGANIVKKCLWAILAAFTFLVFFFSTTAIMSILYPLDAALLSF